MTGSGFSYLITHQFLNHLPIIPEVAYQETVHHLKSRAEKLISNQTSNGERSEGNIRRLKQLFNLHEVSSSTEWDTEELIARWTTYIDRILEEFNGKILSTPQIDTKNLVQRSINRRKPFSGSDRGFRDTIIWLSVLELLNPNTRVSFITNNTQDFFEANSTEPHPQILEEANTRLYNGFKMFFFRSINEFIVKFDSNRTASAEALERALVSNTLSEFDLWKWLKKNMLKIVEDCYLDGIEWAGLSPDAEAPVLIEIDDLISLNVLKTSHIEDETYRFYCDTAFVGKFDCEILLNKADSVINPEQILLKDEKNDAWTKVRVRSIATFLIRIDFDMQTQSVISFFADPLQHWTSYNKAVENLNRNYESTVEDIEDNN